MILVTNRYTFIKYVLTVLMTVSSVALAYSQHNPSFISFKVKQGESYTFPISSTSIPNFQLVSDLTEWGSVQRNEDVDDDNIYEINFNAPTNYSGTIEFLFSYTGQNSFPFYTYTRQVKIMAEVVPSVIETNADIVKSNGQNDLIITPLDNDYTSEESLSISKIAYSSNGQAEIMGGGSVKFIPNSDFQGKAMVTYIAKDNMGTEAEGNIYIVPVNDYFTDDEINLDVSSEIGAYIFLPIEGMFLHSQSANKGNVLQQGKLAYFYSPYAGKLGKDLLEFKDQTGKTLRVNVNIIDNSPDLDAVQDDEIYTAVDQEVIFNVAENDLIDASEIIYFSSDLTKVADGIFRYLPPNGFKGFKKFTYRVNTGSSILIGLITIKIDDYSPLDQKYEFKTPKNKELVLEYDIPIGGYYFSQSSNPQFGSLEFFNVGENVSIACGQLSHTVKVIYTPRHNFIGFDEYDLQYCTEAGNCYVIKSRIGVYDESDSECPCVNNCVYPGDANNDGLVNLTDLLTIGYYLGESGPARLQTTSEWKAHSAFNWPKSQTNGINLMYSDANGDGIISSLDTLSILENYGKYSTYIPTSIEINKRSPIRLVPQSNSIIPGEPFNLDIHLGDDQFPALDVHGINFTLNLDPELFDFENTTFIVEEDSWLAEGFGTIKMFKPSSTGRIDIALSRISGLPKSGKGKIGTVRTIGVEEIEGFLPDKPKQDIEPQVDIEIENVVGMDSKGKSFTVPSIGTTVALKRSSALSPSLGSKRKIVTSIFPNPADELLHIIALDSETLSRVKIYNIVGSLIYDSQLINSKTLDINVSTIRSGIYIVEMIPNQGDPISKKLKISH